MKTNCISCGKEIYIMESFNVEDGYLCDDYKNDYIISKLGVSMAYA